MTMQLTKLSSCSRRRQEDLKSASNRFESALVSMTVASRSRFRHNVPRLLQRREKEAIDEVFESRLSEANQELAHLLRDMRTESQAALPDDHQIQPMKELLMRAVRCAAQQYMLQGELGNLALTDELTGLYSRRGFMALAERQLKLGRRSGRGMLLFMMDVDRLKQINDSFGHFEGDRALKRTADGLRETFRDSDVVARLGGDEFAVLAIEAAGHSEATIKTRLFEGLKSISAEESRYEISLSLGLARFDPDSCTSIGELMVKADQAMCKQKRRRSRPSAILETSYRTQ
jgi:diguanylate cyclase (GGDEF)-like protein